MLTDLISLRKPLNSLVILEIHAGTTNIRQQQPLGYQYPRSKCISLYFFDIDSFCRDRRSESKCSIYVNIIKIVEHMMAQFVCYGEPLPILVVPSIHPDPKICLSTNKETGKIILKPLI